MDDELWWQRAFAYSSFAALGGMLGHMIRTIDKQRKISYGRAVQTMDRGDSWSVGLDGA
jgi:hypothetical protein